jgi:hypothetical protein
MVPCPERGREGTIIDMEKPLSDRSRRLAQVKFMALPLEEEPPLQETASPAGVSSPRGWLRRLLGVIAFRVSGRLVAARP